MNDRNRLADVLPGNLADGGRPRRQEAAASRSPRAVIARILERASQDAGARDGRRLKGVRTVLSPVDIAELLSFGPEGTRGI